MHSSAWNDFARAFRADDGADFALTDIEGDYSLIASTPTEPQVMFFISITTRANSGAHPL